MIKKFYKKIRVIHDKKWPSICGKILLRDHKAIYVFQVLLVKYLKFDLSAVLSPFKDHLDLTRCACAVLIFLCSLGFALWLFFYYFILLTQFQVFLK